ncbi:hypothetical protein IJ843_06020 [bacterium]|nr:hypothetical protein [bacterium]
MERTIKILCLLVVLFCGTYVFAEGQNVIVQPVSAISNTTQTINVNNNTVVPANVSPTVPQMISFEKCTKKYEIPVDNLYFLTLASINANKFTINEIQSKTGYILFTAANRQYLASVNRVDPKSAILKIVPADNNYYFPLGILTNIYKYIDLNVATKIEELG